MKHTIIVMLCVFILWDANAQDNTMSVTALLWAILVAVLYGC